jgi:ankyrin repeat protein
MIGIYYKTTDNRDCYQGYHFIEGLNIAKSFDKKLVSSIQGFSYSSIEDIFRYPAQTRIWDVTLPENDPRFQFVDQLDGTRHVNLIVLTNPRDLWNIPTVQYYINRGANKNQCLVSAAVLGYVHIIEYLIERCVNIHSIDDAALRYAAEGNHMAVIKCLINNGADIHAMNDDALRRAVANNHTDIISYLIECGANYKQLGQIYYMIGDDISTGLLTSDDMKFHFTDARNVPKVLDQGDFIAEIIVPKHVKLLEIAPGKWASNMILSGKQVRLWNITGFCYLADQGITINPSNAFIKSVERGCVDLVAYFIKQGVQVSMDNDLALRQSAARGYLNIICCLVEAGANIHNCDDAALRISAMKGHSTTVAYLLARDANVNAGCGEPLLYSIQYGYFDIVRLLVHHGANVHIKEELPLRMAADRGYTDLVEFLIKNGADKKVLHRKILPSNIADLLKKMESNGKLED